MDDPIAVGTVPWAWIWKVMISVMLINAMVDMTAAMA